MSEITIHLADLENSSHATAIVDLVDSYAREPQGGGKSLPEPVKRRMVDVIRSLPTSFVMLAWEGDVAVGGAICFQGFSTFAAAPLVNVHDLSVREGYRGRGIGTGLLEAVERHAARLGCCKVTLEVREANPQAEALYRRLGYGDPSGFATRFLDKPLRKNSVTL